MHNITSCVLRTLHHLPRAITSSGHFAFQYGRFNDCIDNPEELYHMIEFNVANVTKGITMGICLPKECSNKLVTNVLSEAFKLSGLKVGIERVVTNPQDYPFEYTWVFYITMILILLFPMLVAVASLRRKREGWHKGFALQENIQIISEHRSQQDLNVLNGVRAITMMWTVMGTTFVNYLVGAINILTVDAVFARPFILIIQACLLTSDIFFFLGGFFLAYKFGRILVQSYGKFPLLVLWKVLRVMPAYLMTILIYYSVFMHLGSGPKWIVNEEYTGLCKNMWRSVLFIDNLVNNGHTLCMSWSFYTQIQFQIFVGTVVLLLIYSKSRLASLVVAVGLVIYSWTINLIYSQQHNEKYPVTFEALAGYQTYIFDVFLKPHYRWTPYFFGMFVGLAYNDFLQESRVERERVGFMKQSLGGKIIIFKQLLVRRRKVRIIFEWSGMCILAFVTFFPRALQVGYEWPQAFHSMCLTFGRILYPFAVFLIVLPTMLGVRGSFFRTVLDVKGLNMFASISYSVYLLHGMLIYYNSGIKTYDTYLNITDVYVQALSIILLSAFFGFWLTVIIELPCKYLANGVVLKLAQKLGGNTQVKESLLDSMSEEKKYLGSSTEIEEIESERQAKKG